MPARSDHELLQAALDLTSSLDLKSRAGGRRQGLGSGDGRTDDRGDTRDLVLHLDKMSASLGKFLRHDLGNLRRGRDRISSKEVASRHERAVRQSGIALPEIHLRHSRPPPSP